MQNEIEIKIITAAENGSGIGTWLREHFTPGGIARMFGEGVMPEYKEKMELLREVDHKIYVWTSSFDGLIKQMKAALRSNRMVDLGNYLTELNDKLSAVLIEGGKVRKVTEEALREFEKEQSKTAGIWNDLKREWVVNRTQNQMRIARKAALTEVIREAEKTVDTIKKSLAVMKKARATGHIGTYLDELTNISKAQGKYQLKFVPIYNKYLKGMIEEINEFNRKEQESLEKFQPAVEPVKQEEKPVVMQPVTPKAVMTPVPASPNPTKIPPLPKVPAPKEPMVEESENVIKNVKPDLSLGKQLVPSDPTPEVFNPTVTLDDEPKSLTQTLESKKSMLADSVSSVLLKRQHSVFLEGLAKLAEINHVDAAMFVLSYSEKIEDQDPEASMKLISLADEILG